MANQLAHRGPDGAGIWVCENSHVALGHRRLSILDLSENGAQPMHSSSGRFVLTFNGEIYNHTELRKKLGRHPWRGHSDTEVMLAAIEAWGLKQAVKEFRGMFAFALWDCNQRQLSLGRDRLGIKPLYYGWHNSVFLFGSELKALHAHPEFKAVVCPIALQNYTNYRCVPAPLSIFKNTYKLQPGTVLQLRNPTDRVAPEAYWSAEEVAMKGIGSPYLGSEFDCVNALEDVIGKAVSRRLVADVPVGTLLSGGIDSSLVTAMAQRLGSSRVKTFSVAFDEGEYDESNHAEEIAAYLGTEHTELTVTARGALDLIPSLPELYDEPFADSSQIPTHLIFALARQHIVVGLSGDGGDELFGGYSRYVKNMSRWERLVRFPMWSRHAIGRAAGRTPYQATKLFSDVSRVFGSGRQCAEFLHYRIRRTGAIAASADMSEFHQLTMAAHDWQDVRKSTSTSDVLGQGVTRWRLKDSSKMDSLQKMCLLDSLWYLPNDILTKVDRASMGASLEARVPLLDSDVFEFAWMLPTPMKLNGGSGKWILKLLLSRYVPLEMFDRPKQGFGVPIAAWLRRDLREWAEELLSHKQLSQHGFFDPEPMRQIWADLLAGNDLWQPYIWTLLMFQSWYEKWVAEPQLINTID